jgi:hypothetical protein
VTSALFGPGRLSLTLLRAYRSRPPLLAISVGGPVLLVAESSDTFETLVRPLEDSQAMLDMSPRVPVRRSRPR